MRLTTVALFVALFTLIGLLTVHEEAERLRSAYRTGRLLARRERIRIRLTSVERDLAALTAPDRLARLNRELQLGLTPLSPNPLRPDSMRADASALLDPDGE